MSGGTKRKKTELVSGDYTRAVRPQSGIKARLHVAGMGTVTVTPVEGHVAPEGYVRVVVVRRLPGRFCVGQVLDVLFSDLDFSVKPAERHRLTKGHRFTGPEKTAKPSATKTLAKPRVKAAKPATAKSEPSSPISEPSLADRYAERAALGIIGNSE